MQITLDAMKTIRRHLSAAYPFEGCGFLLGEPESASEPVVLSALVGNNKRIPDGAARTRYLISPDDFLAAERDAAGMSLHIVGTYHSHPDVAARPSGYDLETRLAMVPLLDSFDRRGSRAGGTGLGTAQ